jgi:hypothetical protein
VWNSDGAHRNAQYLHPSSLFFLNEMLGEASLFLNVSLCRYTTPAPFFRYRLVVASLRVLQLFAVTTLLCFNDVFSFSLLSFCSLSEQQMSLVHLIGASTRPHATIFAMHKGKQENNRSPQITEESCTGCRNELSVFSTSFYCFFFFFGKATTKPKKKEKRGGRRQKNRQQGRHTSTTMCIKPESHNVRKAPPSQEQQQKGRNR